MNALPFPRARVHPPPLLPQGLQAKHLQKDAAARLDPSPPHQGLSAPPHHHLPQGLQAKHLQKDAAARLDDFSDRLRNLPAVDLSAQVW